VLRRTREWSAAFLVREQTEDLRLSSAPGLGGREESIHQLWQVSTREVGSVLPQSGRCLQSEDRVFQYGCGCEIAGREIPMSAVTDLQEAFSSRLHLSASRH